MMTFRDLSASFHRLLAITIILALSLGMACNTTDSDSGQIRDAGADSNGEADADDGPCADISCTGAGDCSVVDGEPVCDCHDGYRADGPTRCVAIQSPEEICENACTEPNRGECVVDDVEEETYHCECDDEYVLDSDTDQCVRQSCESAAARTGVTVYDMTPLPDVTDPVANGFDPLLAGDTVRVVTEIERQAGSGGLRVRVRTYHMEIQADTVRLDGELIESPDIDGDRRLELALGDDFESGRLAFDAVIPNSQAAMAGVDARVFTDGCEIDGSASGARLHMAGVTNPKTGNCADMSDVRSLQISTAIPDKDTTVYDERNGNFEEIDGTIKILNQMSLCLKRSDDRTVSLAGSADGTRPWTIDNFLLIEVFDGSPELANSERSAAYITSSANASAPLSYSDGTPIEVIKHATMPGDYTGSRTPSRFTFPAGIVQLDDLLPVGEEVWIRLTGLDEMIAGHMSRLFVTSADEGEFVPECHTGLDCPAPDSASGSNSEMAAGCIDGQCRVETCEDKSDCDGGRCTQGFCNDRCDNALDCPDGTCHQGYCVDAEADNGCDDYADCPRGEVCFFGHCEPGCFHPVDQDPTYSSNNSTYSLCRKEPEACPRCPDPDTQCWYNYCRDCEIDAHCDDGQICANFECTTP